MPSTGKITSLPDCPAEESRWGLSIYSSATFLSCLPDFSVLEFVGKAEISIINFNSRDDIVKVSPLLSSSSTHTSFVKSHFILLTMMMTLW
jgi:hypothetical protein